MQRTWVRHIILLSALLHLFVDVAVTGGAVLCVAPSDHTAVEIGHLAQGCETLYGAMASPGTVFESDACADCTDSPLHAEAEMASRRISGEFDAPPALAACVIPIPPLGAGHIGRPVQNRLEISTTIRAHRSIVLLI